MAAISALAKLLKNPKTARFAESLNHADLPADWVTDPEVVGMAEAAYKELGTDSPFFRAWYRKGQVADNSGQPLTVYHGGGETVSDFSRGPQRGDLGKAYFSDDKETAAKYALLGGIDPDYDSLADYGYQLANAVKRGDPAVAGRKPTVTSVYLNSQKELVPDAGKVTWDDVVDTLGTKKVANAVEDDTALFDRFDGDPDAIAEFLSDKGNLKKYLDGNYDNETLAHIIDNDMASFTTKEGNVTADTPFLFLRGSGLLDKFMREKGYDGIRYLDQETGTPTRTILDATQAKAVKNRGTFNPDDPNIYKGLLPLIGAGGAAAALAPGQAQAAIPAEQYVWRADRPGYVNPEKPLGTPVFDPWDVITGGFGVAGTGAKMLASAATPFVNYVSDKAINGLLGLFQGKDQTSGGGW